MENITIYIRYNEKFEVPTQNNIVLADLLSQLADRGNIPQGQSWIVVKQNSTTPLELGRTLSELGIRDGDVLDLGLPNKAG